jgi:hypothetical protein
MHEDAVDQYLSYKLIELNQDWKAKWFYIRNHHRKLPKLSGKQLKHRPWWNMEPTMQEGIQLPELMQKIKDLREARLRAEHVAFNFMKRRVQPLMARNTLGYQYMGDEDTLMMPDDEVYVDDIVERLGRYSRTCHRTLLAQSSSTPRHTLLTFDPCASMKKCCNKLGLVAKVSCCHQIIFVASGCKKSHCNKNLQPLKFWRCKT